jgi:hypothetical protein
MEAGKTVNPEFREKVIARWEKLIQDTGAPDHETAMQQLIQGFEKVLVVFSLVRTKQDLRNLLDKLPEPNLVEKKLILGFFQWAPQIVQYGVKQFAAKLERELSALPRGRPGTDLQQKAEVVTYVGTLIMKGCSTEVGKRRAAAKFGLSDSTVQRIWDDRGNIEDADFRSTLTWITKQWPGDST